MIHSLAGGKIRELDYADFVKVKVDYMKEKICWYITDLLDLEIGDKVYVDFAGKKLEAEVLLIKRNVSSQVAPVPIKRAKYIIGKIEK